MAKRDLHSSIPWEKGSVLHSIRFLGLAAWPGGSPAEAKGTSTPPSLRKEDSFSSWRRGQEGCEWRLKGAPLLHP